MYKRQLQREHGWLPREALVALSRDMRRPLYEIEGLISFYPHYRREAPPKVELHVCHDLSCWLHGAEDRIVALRERYGDDVEVELREVSCLGRCDMAPAIAVDEEPANVDDAVRLVDAARAEEVPEANAKRPPRTYPNDPYADGEERYRVLRLSLIHI